MKIIKIKDSSPLTFEEWENSGDYDDEVNEAIDNFLYDNGEEVIKYWNEEMPEYAYESVDEMKEDIETERNDIYNLTVGNKKLEKDLRLELESVYEKYHGMIKDDEEEIKSEDKNIDFDYLLSEERKAVQDYKDAIAKTSDKSALYVLSHILKEESHHIELLENLRKGKVEFEDSKDDDFDWGVKLVELSMDNIGDYETDGTPTHIYNIIDYNFFHQNYELLKSEIQKQMEHPEDMTEFEDEFYEFTDHDDLLDFVKSNYVLRRKYQDYIEQLNKKYGKFVREDQAEKTARKIIDKIKKDIKFRK